jgi:hypothetical protein
MKKLLFSTLALTLIFALTASATLTRVLTLGEANNILKDEANIMLYPSTINMYRGLVLGEVTANDYTVPDVDNPQYLYSVGAHYDFGEGNGVVGLYVSNQGDPLFDWDENGVPDAQPDPDGDMATDNRLNLFYGRPFGETQFGMMLSLYRDSHKVEGDTANKTEVNNTTLGLSLGLTMMEQLDLAVGFGMKTWTNKDPNGDEVNTPDGVYLINFNGRYWYPFNDNVDFIPHLMFEYSRFGYKMEGTDGDDKWNVSGLEVDLGWGVNIRPDEHILLLFDFGINYDAETAKNEPASDPSTEDKYTHMDLPYYKVALEGYVTKWWDVRLGAVKKWHGDTQEMDSGVKHIYGDAFTDTYLGSGFHFGNLTLDAWLDPNFVLKGPNFVSGYDGDLAGMVSIKYAWGE